VYSDWSIEGFAAFGFGREDFPPRCNALFRTDGTRILMITHNLGQATRLGDDVVFMSAGKVREHAPVRRFFARPASEEARLFIQGELPWRLPL
jgi:ABC-type methionine transport system ATPase subunit